MSTRIFLPSASTATSRVDGEEMPRSLVMARSPHSRRVFVGQWHHVNRKRSAVPKHRVHRPIFTALPIVDDDDPPAVERLITAR